MRVWHRAGLSLLVAFGTLSAGPAAQPQPTKPAPTVKPPIDAASGQTRPNFSGTWIAVDGAETVVRQDAKTIRWGHDSEGGDHVEVYNLDGSETTNKMASHGDFIVSTCRATWDKDHLILRASTVYPDGRRLATMLVLSLDETGRLVVDVTETIDGKPSEKRRVVFRKK